MLRQFMLESNMPCSTTTGSPWSTDSKASRTLIVCLLPDCKIMPGPGHPKVKAADPRKRFLPV